MLILRPIDEGDLLPLMEMLGSAGFGLTTLPKDPEVILKRIKNAQASFYSQEINKPCLLYTSPSPRDQRGSRMPSSA